MNKWLRKFLPKSNELDESRVCVVDKSNRNDSGEYVILVNNHVVLPCKVIESISIDSYNQLIKTEFYTDKNLGIKCISLLDMNNNNELGHRVLPRTIIMRKGDSLVISWTLKCDRL